MTTQHPPSDYFDLAGSSLAELFTGAEQVWDVLGDPLGNFIKKHIRPGNRGTVEEGAILVGDDIEIGEGSVVEAGAYIKGPTIIGKNCEVRHGAYIRGKTLVGNKCVVGHATEVKSSVFLDGSKAAHFAYVGDSVLGHGANLGAGTRLANFKLTADAVKIPSPAGTIDTGRRKFGAIVGDGVQTGCNSVMSPGTLLGPRTFVYPCVSVRAGIYKAAARIKQ